MKKIIAIFMIIMVCSHVGNIRVQAENVTEAVDYGKEIDNFVKEYEVGLASMEVAVYNDEGLLYSGYYGYSKRL